MNAQQHGTATRWEWFFVLATAVAIGCTATRADPGANGKPAATSPGGPGGAPPPPPEVIVSLPVQGEVTDYEDFPGRTESVHAVELRSRVTGYLERVNFRDGADVEEGDVLFEIDSRPYQAELDKTEAALSQAQAHLRRRNVDYERATNLLAKNAISREEFDRVDGDRAEASAAVGVAEATRNLALLNVGFTKVKAPISGRISRRFVDPGNLIKADETMLSWIVSLNPMHATFDLDEHTALRLQRLIREGKLEWSMDHSLPVMLGLASDEGFPHSGTINFADNRIDPDTGTWRLRGLFDNTDGVLQPGMFVRIRLPIGKPYPAILAPEQAIGTDQGQKFVYVVDGEGQVSYRRVKVGRLQNGMRVVSDGLELGEQVVVRGLQRVRVGTKVAPKLSEEDEK